MTRAHGAAEAGRIRSEEEAGIGTESPGSVRASTIAIDGPAASGKSAVGALVAARLGYRFLDTGAMYRAVTWAALDRDIDVRDAGAVAALTTSLRIDVRLGEGAAIEPTGVVIDGVDVTACLRDPDVEANVSLVSRVAEVRRTLVAIQRALAASGRIAMAGRDIGSVVLTDADLKVYLDASREVRARRRADQLRAAGEQADVPAILADLERRDGIDSSRAVSPLTAARGAVMIDTDDLTIDQVVERILEAAA
ncbi:MAG: (d)CMP kinase [Dehalococcoidia bacterium]|nr:(d)CMP kinase [Dehalococcoidia bacterium]